MNPLRKFLPFAKLLVFKINFAKDPKLSQRDEKIEHDNLKLKN